MDVSDGCESLVYGEYRGIGIKLNNLMVRIAYKWLIILSLAVLLMFDFPCAAHSFNVVVS